MSNATLREYIHYSPRALFSSGAEEGVMPLGQLAGAPPKFIRIEALHVLPSPSSGTSPFRVCELCLIIACYKTAFHRATPSLIISRFDVPTYFVLGIKPAFKLILLQHHRRSSLTSWTLLHLGPTEIPSPSESFTRHLTPAKLDVEVKYVDTFGIFFSFAKPRSKLLPAVK